MVSWAPQGWVLACLSNLIFLPLTCDALTKTELTLSLEGIKISSTFVFLSISFPLCETLLLSTFCVWVCLDPTLPLLLGHFSALFSLCLYQSPPECAVAFHICNIQHPVIQVPTNVSACSTETQALLGEGFCLFGSPFYPQNWKLFLNIGPPLIHMVPL